MPPLSRRRATTKTTALRGRRASFFAGGGDGLNVTVPFKAKALQFADHASAFARRAGVANVLARKGGRVMAYNTDGGGLVRALAAALPGGATERRVALLGAGGAARAAAFALGEGKPAALQIYNRTAERARALAALTGAEFCETPPVGANIVINATSAAAQGELALPPPEVFANADLAMDLMYGEAALPWLRHAAASGAKQTADGIVMLAWQAALSFAVWEGVLPTVAPLLQALAARPSGAK